MPHFLGKHFYTLIKYHKQNGLASVLLTIYPPFYALTLEKLEENENFPKANVSEICTKESRKTKNPNLALF